MPERSRAERWFPLLFLACAFIAVWPAFAHRDAFAWPYDWRYFQSWIEVGRRSLLWYHQLPLWNPYGCGGEVLLANPQSEVAAPTFVLPLVFGTALGVKLVLVFYLFCAFGGMYRLARDHELSIVASWFAAVLFGAGGWLALHLSSGHSNFASAGLFPYLVLFYRRGSGDLAWAIPLGAVAAWIVALGGTSTPAMAAVLLFTIATTDAITRRSLRPYAVLGAGAGCAALLGAVRLLPALEFSLDHPRRQWETDRSSLFEIIRNGYVWRGLEAVPGKRYWFHEYGWRLSWVTPPFVLASVFARKTRAWWVVAIVGATIVAGSAIPFGPWWMLKHLPIYRDLRVPSRYALLLAIAMPLLCAGALDQLREWLVSHDARRLAAALSTIVVVIALADGVAYDHARFKDVFTYQALSAGRGSRFYHQRGEWRTMLNVVLLNHGALACDEEAPLQRAAELDEGDVPQVRLLDPAAGEIRESRWTPNRIDVSLRLQRPTTVMINENWNEHFRASTGRVVRVGEKHPRDRDGGRLGVEAPAGEYTLTVLYRPRSFVIGAVVSGLTLPLAVAFWWVRRRKRKAPSP
jgi:hypothetical protein